MKTSPLMERKFRAIGSWEKRTSILHTTHTEKRDTQMPLAVIYTCAAMLFLGVAPLPYGYYTLLRLVVCGVFAFAAVVAFQRKAKTTPWLYGLMAVLFNPIIKIHFPKEMWAFIDIAAGILLVVTAKSVKDGAS